MKYNCVYLLNYYHSKFIPMKNISILLLFSFLLLSCEKDDNKKVKIEEKIIGTFECQIPPHAYAIISFNSDKTIEAYVYVEGITGTILQEIHFITIYEININKNTILFPDKLPPPLQEKEASIIELSNKKLILQEIESKRLITYDRIK